LAGRGWAAVAGQGIDELLMLMMCLRQEGHESLMLPPFVLDINLLPTRRKTARHYCLAEPCSPMSPFRQLRRNSKPMLHTRYAVFSFKFLSEIAYTDVPRGRSRMGAYCLFVHVVDDGIGISALSCNNAWCYFLRRVRE
jgi:hypothetical protein